MNRRIVILGENTSSYMMKSLEDSLVHAEFTVTLVDAKVRLAGIASAEPEIILIYTSEELVNCREALKACADYTRENGKTIGLIGYREELIAAFQILPKELVGHVFERPLNIAELVEYYDNELEKKVSTVERKHILVVDDSGPSLRAIKSWLEGEYQISVASSAAMAISFLSSHKPDLILLDYEMPICNGPQFLSMIRAESTTSEIPVMFLTTKDDAESVKSVIALKPEGYLLKTLPPAKIIEAVGEFFAKQGA